MIRCYLVNNHEPIIRGGFFFYYCTRVSSHGSHCSILFSSFLIFPISDKMGAIVSFAPAYCTASFSQRARVMTGSDVRPTLGWYVLCLRPVLQQWAYGRRCWRLTSVLSPLPTNRAEANMMIVFNSSDILIQGYALTGFIEYFCLIYWLFWLLLKS